MRNVRRVTSDLWKLRHNSCPYNDGGTWPASTYSEQMTPPSNSAAAAKLPAGVLGLAALLAASAANHFVRPGFYYPVVPPAITFASGPLTRDGWIRISGVLEFAAAAGLLIPQTRHAAGTCTSVMFAGFTAGHLSALKRAFGPDGTKRARIIHSLRLPLQVPLVVWAWRTRLL